MRFKVGERISFLNETGEGTIQSYINDEVVIVLDETGFDREILEKELVKIYNEDISITQKDDALHELLEVPNAGQTRPRGVNKQNGTWEIDLHSHMIMDSEQGLSNNQILTRQLYAFKHCYTEAREKHIRKLIVIHGVGEGVLKSEVRHFLAGRENLEFYDADFREYGKGATEINLFYR